MPETLGEGSFRYGHQRSRSLAFGHTTVEIGEDVAWSNLIAASVEVECEKNLVLYQRDITEVARFSRADQVSLIS
jgi:hypothetical protein